ncbi:uncharacterized protein LOC120326249 isoform X1 [Styela clava]
MAGEIYLQKRLVGLERTADEKYCTGKFTDCTKTLVEGFISTSCCSFVRISSHFKGSSKRFKAGNSTKSTIYFSQTNSTVPIPYHGYPFEVIATEKWNCNETSSMSKKHTTNEDGSKKRKSENNNSCSASIQIRTIRIYTEYGLPQYGDISEADIKKQRDDMKSKLLEAMTSKKSLKYTDIHYCRFPLAPAHDHSQQSSRLTATQLDKRVTKKIRELAKSGISDVHNIKAMVSDFVINTLFAHAEAEEKPKPDNPRYFPSIKAIRNHIFLAVGKVSNIPGYGQSKQIQSDDTMPPSVTKVMEIPLETSSTTLSNLENQKFNVGFVAVHAGAGFHSDDRWPGYKHLCEKVCEEVTEQLKHGVTAGEAVTLAIKMLEDSEMTNAGIGSNLTEDGKIECDASVMDTCPSPDSSNQCSSYFGSVACVGRIKNPICAAYKILDEQRKRPRLELGRIPPSFLVSEGAENWSRAHGIELCQTEDLISESSYKSWQKYHRKLVEKLTRSRQYQDKEEDNVQNEEELNKRLDTVGAVVLDMQGNVAAAVSSGGLILKMPGRVGQAAMYGCGCWASPGKTDKPAIAVSTSGCGEQLISTTLAKICAGNLQKDEQPYQAIQDTLVKDFLGSSMLNSDCDKQAGLLCLHHTKDSFNCTIEVVWGHTTSSMVIGHMSTNDNNPKTVLSRLPDNAIPGKSVTVGGSWIKVACSENTIEDRVVSNTEMETNNTSIDEALHNEVTIEVNTKNNDHQLIPLDGNMDDEKTKEFIDPDITIMFSSPIPDGIHESMCHVVFSDEFNRKIDPEFEKSIINNWEKRVADNPRFFNAQKFRIQSIDFRSTDETPQFTFNLGLTCYRDYMETNWSKDVHWLQDKGIKDYDNSQAYLAEPLGVAAIVITDDDKVVFQWRNLWVAESPGMLDVPGGHPEPTDAAGFTDSKKFVTFNNLHPDNTVHEIFYSQMKEVRDELNVPIEKVSNPILTGIIRNNLSAGRPVAYYNMRCHMTSDEILHQYSKGGLETDESTKLQFIPEKVISSLSQDQPELWKKMCPNGKAAVTLYTMLLNKKLKKKSGKTM